MSYVALSSLNKKIEEGKLFTLTIDPRVPLDKDVKQDSGVYIDFLDKRPQDMDEKKGNYIFRFNPKPTIQINLDSCKEGVKQKGILLEDHNIPDKLFRSPFDLAIQVLPHVEEGSEFLVFLNEKFQTTFKSPTDITHTKFIGFSPSLRISADVKDFENMNQGDNNGVQKTDTSVVHVPISYAVSETQ